MKSIPLPQMTSAQVHSERHARLVYLWFFSSMFITLPLMNLGLSPLSNEVVRKASWSPDGRQIVFVSGTSYWDYNAQIYVANADGQDPKFLANMSLDSSFGLSWSPDSSQIAFVTNAQELYVINADGSGLRQLSDLWTLEGDWSPDGKHIGFTGWSESVQDIYIVNADGTGLTNLTDDPARDYFREWSPDGKQIVFISVRDGSEDIYVINTDGSDIKRFTNTQKAEIEDNPASSPDGQHILVSSELDIYIANADGSGSRKLTAASTQDFLWAVAWPQAIHIVLLLGLFSPHIYVRRHTQQALILVCISALTTVLLLGLTRSEGYSRGIWVIVNGFLWIFGTMWGIRQVLRGECWLMRVTGNQADLPRRGATRLGTPALPSLREFVIGFVGWFIFNSLLFGAVFIFLSIAPLPVGGAEYVVVGLLSLCSLISCGVLIILAISRHWMALGPLTALTANIGVSLLLFTENAFLFPFMPVMPFFMHGWFVNGPF